METVESIRASILSAMADASITSQEDFVSFVANIKTPGDVFGRMAKPTDTGFWDPDSLAGAYADGTDEMLHHAVWWYRATAACFLGLIPDDADCGDYDKFYGV